MGISRFISLCGSVIVVAAWVTSAAAQPAAAPAAGSKADTANPTLQQVLERLNRVERELETLKKSGKVPLDKKDQRVIVGLETPFLGSPYYSQTNPRAFAARLLFVNLTDQKLVLKSDDIKLDVDGQELSMKDLSPQWQHVSIQIGNQGHQLRALQMAKEVTVPVGGNASTWVLFQDLQPGNHVPDLKLKIKTATVQKEIDINAQQRDVLGMTIDRIGPGKCLGLITIAGLIDPINVGSLVDEIDKLTGDKVTRIVIRWTDQAPPLDHRVYPWLSNSAQSLGRQQMNEMDFPTMPISIRELHLANMPHEQARSIVRNRSLNNSPEYQRFHATDLDAVVAALQSAYEAVPRDELTLAIQGGSRLEKAAALIGGGGRLSSDKLPLLLQLADDNDPALQQAALTALAHFGEKEAVEKLVAYARKNLPKLSETAIGSLAASRFAVAQEAVLELLKNETPEGKKAIVRLLAKHPRPMWSDAIYQFVKGQNSDLGVEALKALVQVGHPQLVTVLKEALASNQPGMRDEAFARLAERTDRESEELAINFALEQLKTQPPTEPVRVLLNRVKDKRALPLLWKQFDRSPNKISLLQTFALIGDQETARELLARFPRLQEYERGETLKVLAKLDPPQFRRLASQSMTGGGSLVNYAVQALQEDGSPEAIKILADALDQSTQQHVWANVCNALALLGTPVGRAALVKARDSGVQEKRTYAQNALAQLQVRSPGYNYLQQAKSFVQQSRWKEAIDQFDLALQMDPQLSDAYAERGNAYLHQTKLDLAAKDFEKCIELDPYNHQGLTGVCIVMVVKDGKYAEAVKKVEEGRTKFGENAVFRYNVACVYSRACEYLKKNDKIADREKLLKDYTEKALKEIELSIQGGFQDFAWMQKDPDLKFLQDNADFKKLIDKAKESGRGVGNAIPRQGRLRGRRFIPGIQVINKQ